MSSKKDMILAYLESEAEGRSTAQIASGLGMQRTNVSSLLNSLVREKRIEKTTTRPVLYRFVTKSRKRADDAFEELTGSSQTLLNACRLCRAALLYPGHPLPLLVSSPSGAGKSEMIRKIEKFARENQIVSEEVSTISVNCRPLSEKNLDADPLFGPTGFFVQARDGILVLKHVQELNEGLLGKLFSWVEDAAGRETEPRILIAQIDDGIPQNVKSRFQTKFPMSVDLPGLGAFTQEERLEMIRRFLQDEAGKMKRTVVAGPELLKALLLCQTPCNIRSLRSEIRYGCANAFVRQLDAADGQAQLSLQDFSPEVRKGLLYIPDCQEQLKKLIPNGYSNFISKEDISFGQTEYRNREVTLTTYEFIEEKAGHLGRQGLTDEQVADILYRDLQERIDNFIEKYDANRLHPKTYEIVVDARITDAVNRMLQKASASLNRTFSASVGNGIALHLETTIEQGSCPLPLSGLKASQIKKASPIEYSLASELVREISGFCGFDLPDDEIVFIVSFLLSEDESKRKQPHPSVVIAMHGEGIAAAICRTVELLIGPDLLSHYDMPLGLPLDEAYRELSETIRQADAGKGVLLLYDMGSIRDMALAIQEELGIAIECLQIPVSVIALDSTIRARCEQSLSELYQQERNALRNQFSLMEGNFERAETGKVIVTLCSSGKGGAQAIRSFLLSNLEGYQIDVINLALNDRKALISEINRIRQSSEIVCLIGAYNPHLFDLPFVSFSSIFEVSTDKLPMLLTLEKVEFDSRVDYGRIMASLAEELPGFDEKSMKEILPRTVRRIGKAAGGLDKDQQLGLMMHLACSAYAIERKESSSFNPKKEQIFERYKTLASEIREAIEEIEEEYLIHFPDDEIANIICTVKKL